MQIHRDLVYARANGLALLLDLYLPDEVARSLPLVVWVHGGAWLAGDKENPPALRMVSRGYAVASLNYRLSQQAIFPAQIHDCKAAIRWLRAKAAAYHLNADHVGVWGHSAGGHLVALLGTSGDVQELEGDLGNPAFSSRVQAACVCSGPSDFRRMRDMPSIQDHDAADSPESLLLGGAIQQNPDKVAHANPITYARAGAPPFLLIHGRADVVVPVNQALLLDEALRKAGADVTLRIVDGAGHDFNQIDDEAVVNAFFDRCLK